MNAIPLIGRLSSLCTQFRTGLAMAGVATVSAVLAAPEAQAVFQPQFETDFDNRFYEFFPAGTRPNFFTRQDLIEESRQFPTFAERAYSTRIPDKIVLEEDEVTTTPDGNLRAANGMPGRVFVDDEDRFILQPPPIPRPSGTPTPATVTGGQTPFDQAFSFTPRSLLGVQGRDGLEVRYSGRDLVRSADLVPLDPGLPVLAAQTETELVTDAQRYQVSMRLRVDDLERRGGFAGDNPGFYIDVDLGNGLSGDFTIEIAKDQNNRNSIYLFNSRNGVTRRVGTFETGDQALRLAATINATNSRLLLKIDGETVYRGSIDLNNSISYSPTVLLSLVEKVASEQESLRRGGNHFSSVSLMNFNSYYNPEPGTVMVGIAGLSVLMRRRRTA